MIVILATDDKGGMLFNNRRQSQDQKLRERMLARTKQKPFWMNHYSGRQFSSMEDIQNIVMDEAFLEKAGKGEYCFVEDRMLMPYFDKIERVILYKWNRTYPSDFCFDIDLSGCEWKLLSVMEFQGSSHEKITEEIYEHETY